MTKIINVNLKNNKYKIIIGNNTLNKVDYFHKHHFKKRKKIIIFDKNLINNSILKLLIKKLGKNTPCIAIPPGEKSKSIERLEKLYNKLFQLKIDRSTILYAFGGGVIGDLTGFTASTIMRGVDYVQIPTTLLSQIDSSVGGKTAINNKYGKNLIGSFYQPKLVLIDTRTLKTLPKRQMISGYAEMVKYSFIKDRSFFSWLEKNGNLVLKKNSEKLEFSINKCCKAKAKIVEKDEKDIGQRAILNFGHTFAHAFERVSNYKDFTHGEAVAVGMLLAFKLSTHLKFCPKKDLNRVIKHYNQLKLPTNIKYLLKNITNTNKIVSAMKLDKKTINNLINFILVKGIGKGFICDTVNEKSLIKFLNENISNNQIKGDLK